MHQAIDRCGGCHWVLEDYFPLAKREIAREHYAATFVAFGQQREQDFHLLSTLLHVPDVVNQYGVVPCEPFEYTT